MDLELLRANLVRTLVPLIVGALVQVLGVKADPGLSVLVGFAVSGAYYAVFRIAETRYPWLGVFLGKRMSHGAPVESSQDQPAGAAAVLAPAAGSPAVAADPRCVGVRLAGVEVTGVESVVWSSGLGEPTMLTLRIRDPQVELTPATATQVPAGSTAGSTAAPAPT